MRCAFFCRGKLLNVRDAAVTQINGNAEINAIKQILGLQHGKVGLCHQCSTPPCREVLPELFCTLAAPARMSEKHCYFFNHQLLW